MKKDLPQPKTPGYLTDCYIFLNLTALPLCFGPGGYADITQVKFSAFLLISGGYAALMLLLWAELAVTGVAKMPGLKSLLKNCSRTQGLVLCYMLLTALAWALSPWRAEAFIGMTRYEGFLTIGLYCLCFLLVSVFGRPAKWQLYVLGVTMTLVCAVAALQLAGKNPFGLYPGSLTYYDAYKAYSGEYLGTIGNTDLLAALMCMAGPALLLGALKLKSRWRRLLLVPAALCLYVTVRMRVDAAFAGLAGCCLLTLPQLEGDPGRRKKLWLAEAAAVLGAVLAVYVLPDMPGALGELHNLLHGTAEDSYGSGRVYIWRSVWQAVLERPWFGGGPDTLSARITAVFRRYDASLGGVIETSIDVAHNEYLNIWACQGIFALLAYAGALFCAAADWMKSRSRPAALIAGSAAAGYCVQAFFGFSMCFTAPLFWMALALLEKSTKEKDNE